MRWRRRETCPLFPYIRTHPVHYYYYTMATYHRKNKRLCLNPLFYTVVWGHFTSESIDNSTFYIYIFYNSGLVFVVLVIGYNTVLTKIIHEIWEHSDIAATQSDSAVRLYTNQQFIQII